MEGAYKQNRAIESNSLLKAGIQVEADLTDGRPVRLSKVEDMCPRSGSHLPTSMGSSTYTEKISLTLSNALQQDTMATCPLIFSAPPLLHVTSTLCVHATPPHPPMCRVLLGLEPKGLNAIVAQRRKKAVEREMEFHECVHAHSLQRILTAQAKSVVLSKGCTASHSLAAP